jgi:hypothetical protein
MATIAEQLIEKKARLVTYRDAELKILQSQQYAIKDKSLQRTSLNQVRAGIKELEKEIARLERGGGVRVRRVVPRDL